MLDVNSFHCFFNPSCQGYSEFEPLHEWLYHENGTKIVYGGTTNIKEIDHLAKYKGYLLELKKISKFIQIDSKLVDKESERIRNIVNKKDFDDPHIVALLAVSGCIIFASHDQRSDKYVKRKDLYPKHTPKRVIYRRKQHAVLLTEDKIVNLQNIVK